MTLPPDPIRQRLRARPPAPTLAWAEQRAGNGMQTTSVAWLAGGSSHANHAITLTDAHGTVRELVLRRWVRPDWQTTDPEFTPQREIAALTLLANADVPAPRLVAADVDAASCDVPALLETRVPGHPPRRPADLDGFCRQLAAVLPSIHAVEGRAGTIVPSFRAYVDVHATAPPPWAPSDIWRHAWEVLAQSPPPSPACFIHRDYHPDNTLWIEDQLTAVVDWTYASLGPVGVDLGHMRWNLVLDYGPDAAERFLRHHAELAGTAPHQPYWDIRTTVDLIGDGDPHESTPRPRPQRPRGPRHTRPPRTRLTPFRCERRAGAP